MTTFYRLHRALAPAFSAENAYSAQWGATWNERGDRYECMTCDGTGTSLLDADQQCPTCNGDAWLDADYGYSCCYTAEDLISYMTEHGVVLDTDPVVAFEGRQVGTGGDGEPLAIPTGRVEWTTWGELVATVSA